MLQLWDFPNSSSWPIYQALSSEFMITGKGRDHTSHAWICPHCVPPTSLDIVLRQHDPRVHWTWLNNGCSPGQPVQTARLHAFVPRGCGISIRAQEPPPANYLENFPVHKKQYMNNAWDSKQSGTDDTFPDKLQKNIFSSIFSVLGLNKTISKELSNQREKRNENYSNRLLKISCQLFE